MVLAVRAMAVAAGMRHEELMFAVLATDLHLQTGLIAAALHCRECPPLIGVEPAAILCQQVGFEGIDDGGEANHLTFLQVTVKLFIRPLIRSMALCLVCSVKWV